MMHLENHAPNLSYFHNQVDWLLDTASPQYKIYNLAMTATYEWNQTNTYIDIT